MDVLWTIKTHAGDMATVLYLLVMVLSLALLAVMYRADEKDRRYRRRTRIYQPPRIHTGETVSAPRVREASNSRPWR